MNQHDPAWDDPQLLKKKRIIGIASLVGVLLLFVVITFLLRKPLLGAIRDKASFRDWMQGTGFWKYPLMIGIMALQVIIALIPGEPIEIVAGYIFGAWGGLLLCLLGTALGSVLIILIVRKLGMKFVTLFVERKQIENLKFFRDPKKRDATIFLLFLIPGTPKDILTYLSGLVPIHLGKYLLLTSVARIPSILTSTMGGNMLGEQEYKVAIIVFAVTAVLTGLAMLAYRAWQKRQDALEAASEAAALAEHEAAEALPAAEEAPSSDELLPPHVTESTPEPEETPPAEPAAGPLPETPDETTEDPKDKDSKEADDVPAQ